MAKNKRLYYAIKQIGITPDAAGATVSSDREIVYGAQDISISTNFNLTQIFTMGQLEIYQSLEELPDVEVSISKVIDGRPLIWHIATKGGSSPPTSPTLAGRSNEKCILDLGIFPDSNDAADGTPDSVVQCSGLFPRTLNYNFGIDGAFTESLTLVGNDKIFSSDQKIVNPVDTGRRATLSGSSYFPGQFSASATESPSGIERKEALLFAATGTAITGTDINGAIADYDITILPPEVEGISSSGTNDKTGSDFNAHIQSIAISTDLGREELNELGRRGPYHRFATFPTEVTCAIEAISTEGDDVSATEGGIYSTSSAACDGAGSNLKDRTIRIATCGGVRIYLGAKNRLSSVDFGGGTTDGGNDTNTYNFTNFNILTVMAKYDPHADADTWWDERDKYLLTTG